MGLKKISQHLHQLLQIKEDKTLPQCSEMKQLKPLINSFSRVHSELMMTL